MSAEKLTTLQAVQWLMHTGARVYFERSRAKAGKPVRIEMWVPEPYRRVHASGRTLRAAVQDMRAKLGMQGLCDACGRPA